MARKIYYKVLNNKQNIITDEQWDNILRLQHWYNSEFIWTAGKLGFKMFAVFPNIESKIIEPEELQNRINERRSRLQGEGLSQNQIIRKLESEGLIIILKGGYSAGCIASGFTRVADNEFNAYLVCDFLLKASKLAPDAVISIIDEGEFIKTKKINLKNGIVSVTCESLSDYSYFQTLVSNKHIFSIVDSSKYNHHPEFHHTIANFNNLTKQTKRRILVNWNWLGFENNYDQNGDDFFGYDLNTKVNKFELSIK